MKSRDNQYIYEIHIWLLPKNLQDALMYGQCANFHLDVDASQSVVSYRHISGIKAAIEPYGYKLDDVVKYMEKKRM